MPSGTVKWFNAERGYGYIASDSGSRDIFVHHSQITPPGPLELGQRVTFDGQEIQGKQQAVNVTIG